VLGHDRGGRCQYDAASKRGLIEACLRPGVSVARLAQENGINANLLRKWISRYLLERERNLANQAPTECIAALQTNSSSTVDVTPITRASEAVEAASPFVPIVAASPVPVAAPPVQPVPPSMTLALHVHLLSRGTQFSTISEGKFPHPTRIESLPDGRDQPSVFLSTDMNFRGC
jgi:transposase